MTQAQTLQDIYTKIADIYDKFCDFSVSGDDETYLATNITLSDTTYTATALAFANPQNKQSITDAQTRINALIADTLVIAKLDRLPTDAVFAAQNGDLVPIPKGSPIALLPKLLQALLLYTAPLKVLINIIVKIIEDVLYEFLKRKLNEKNATIASLDTITASKIIELPSTATHLLIQISNIPNYISKRFDADIDKTPIKIGNQANPDLSKYLRNGLATVSFGCGLSGQIISKDVFWDKDITIEYASQILEIPNIVYSNIEKYLYIYLDEQITVNLRYFKQS